MKNQISWQLHGFYPEKYGGARTIDDGYIENAFLFYGEKTVEGLLKNILPKLAEEARRRCPVSNKPKTVHLKDTIEWFIDPSGQWGAYGSNADYAIYVEYGTKFMKGRHFLKGALRTIQVQSLLGMSDVF